MEPSATLEADKPAVAQADANAGQRAEAQVDVGSGYLDGEHIVEELLLEEISIDGMCGVY